jgi:hypothetical protein
VITVVRQGTAFSRAERRNQLTGFSLPAAGGPLRALLLSCHTELGWTPSDLRSFCNRTGLLMTREMLQQAALESTLAKVHQNKPLQLPLE